MCINICVCPCICFALEVPLVQISSMSQYININNIMYKFVGHIYSIKHPNLTGIDHACWHEIQGVCCHGSLLYWCCDKVFRANTSRTPLVTSCTFTQNWRKATKWRRKYGLRQLLKHSLKACTRLVIQDITFACLLALALHPYHPSHLVS